jgi:hypothetical protein
MPSPGTEAPSPGSQAPSPASVRLDAGEREADSSPIDVNLITPEEPALQARAPAFPGSLQMPKPAR